jgi:hypothetical protein
MEAIFQKMLNSAVKSLETLEKRGFVKFKVIADDEEYGDLEVVQEKKRTRSSSAFPIGTVRDYVMPFIKDMRHDEIVSIPFDKFDPESLRGNACSWCTTAWGKGTYTSTVNKDAGTVEIYRHAV